MIVAAKPPLTGRTHRPARLAGHEHRPRDPERQHVNAHLDTLTRMTDALSASTRGQLSQIDMIRQWRSNAASLPLPDKFGTVLGDLLDRIEASALFSEESCSFSQKDLLDKLQLWADKARGKLSATRSVALAPTWGLCRSGKTSDLKAPTCGADLQNLSQR